MIESLKTQFNEEGIDIAILNDLKEVILSIRLRLFILVQNIDLGKENKGQWCFRSFKTRNGTTC